MEKAPRHFLLSAVIFREGDGYSAVLLQHFIAAQGATIEQARHALACSIVGQLRLDIRASRQPFETLSAAPEKYWRMFEQGQPMEVHPIQVPPATMVSVPPAFIVESIAVAPAA